jgi:hypothetical protein
MNSRMSPTRLRSGVLQPQEDQGEGLEQEGETLMVDQREGGHDQGQGSVGQCRRHRPVRQAADEADQHPPLDHGQDADLGQRPFQRPEVRGSHNQAPPCRPNIGRPAV